MLTIVTSQEQLNEIIEGRLGQLDTISGNIKLPNPCNDESVLHISFGTKKRPAYISYNCGYRIEVVGGYAEAALCSEVIARGSATVIARDSATVIARDSSTVIALDRSYVKAYDHAVVNAYASSRIEVEVYNNNLVSLYEGAKVTHHKR